MNNKKGLSTVIAVLLIVLLTVVSVVIIYGVVSTMIRGKLDDTKKCGPEILDKVTLNKRYTCFYNHTLNVDPPKTGACVPDPNNCKEIPTDNPLTTDTCKNIGLSDRLCTHTTGFQYVSINVGDIDVDKVIVTIGDGVATKDYEIKDGPPTTIYNYGIGSTDFDGIESGSSAILKLVKKQGRTYVIKPGDLPTLNYKPQQVRVTPVIGSKRCGVADQVLEIPSCDPDFGFPVLFSTP